MSIQPAELRARLAARANRARLEVEGRQASLAWLVASANALAEEEGAAFEVALDSNFVVPGKASGRRRLEAWARGNAALGLEIEVETRAWCRRLDQARAQ